MSLIVVGTDTEVGKTVVSGLILARYASRAELGYWKPVATGLDDGDRDAERIADWVGSRAHVAREAYLYGPPVSPHLAARRARKPIDTHHLLAEWRRVRRENPGREWVVEGIGGLLVPFDDAGRLLADWLRQLRLPLVLVTRSTLGTINHTLLSLEAMRRRRLRLAGVVMVGPHDQENRRAIEQIGKAPVIAEVPRLDPVDRTTIREAAARFDRRALLGAHLAR